jgi:ABC-type Fe3+-hydroxamate transport system substrate-binding protein
MTVQSFSDQIGSEISIAYPPKRIVSLVPSQTELLAYLGLDDSVVGITKFCVHPSSWRSTKTIIGGTKNFHFDTIERLRPDLIIGNKEENYQEGIERLKDSYPVWMSDIVSIDDALSMIESIGRITAKAGQAEACKKTIAEKRRSQKQFQSQSVLYLIWKDPWMAAGGSTFINSMLDSIGLHNVVGSRDRYPVLTEGEINELNPSYILLSSEPYPFKAQHATEMKGIAPASKTLLVDGEMFSWYGSRMIAAFDYFKTLPIV